MTLGGANGGSITSIIGTGAGSVTKQDAGSWMLTGANTYSGDTTISAGTLQVGSGGATGSLGSGNIANSGALVFNLSSSPTISAVISGTGSLTKSGSGTLTLSGLNTYTGATTINAGTLSVSTIGNGGVSGNLGAATNAAANLVLGGGTLQYTGATASSDRNFTLTGGTTNIIDVIGGTTLTLSGASTNTTGALTKTGSGTLLLSGSNLYTGATSINAGTLTLGSATGLSSSTAVTVGGSGTLNLASYSPSIGSINNSGTITFGSGNTLTTSGNQTHSGTITGTSIGLITTGAGAFSFSNPTSLFYTVTTAGGNIVFNNAVTLGANSTLNAGAGSVTFASTIDSTAGNYYTLTSSGSGANSFGGAVGSTNPLGAISITGPTTLNGNVTTNNANIGFTGAVTLGANSALSAGSGTISLGSTANGGFDFGATAATLNLSGALGGSTRLGNVSLTSTNALSLPAITAGTIFARSTGGTADLTLTGNLNANTATTTPVTLVAGQNFLNTGNYSISVGANRWLIYSTNRSGTNQGTLSEAFRRYSCTYGGTCPTLASGNGMLFSFTPVLIITPDAYAALTYGDAVPTFAGHTYGVSGYQSGDSSATNTIGGTASYSTNYTQYADVGNYNITSGVGALTSTQGYSFQAATRSNAFSVSPKAASITASAQSITYGDGNIYNGFTQTGFVNGQTVGAVTFATNATSSGSGNWNQGSWIITPSAATGGTFNPSNYSITYNTGALTVNQRPITVTPDSGQSKTYGNGDPTLTYTLTSGNLVGSDSLSGALARAAGETVAGGPYAINLGTIANGNYAITFTGGRTFAISQRPITVTPDSGQTKVYGNVDPTLTYTLTSGNLVGADSLSGALARTAGETVAGGPYAINLGTIANGNYAISFTNSRTFAISQRPITVTPDNGQTKVYGNVDPTLTYTLTSGNLVGADSLSGALARAAGETVAGGTYAINLGTIANGNYAISFTGGRTFAITQRPLTVTASDQTREYGFGGTPTALGTTGYSLTGGTSLGNSDAISSITLATDATLSTASQYKAGTWRLYGTGIAFNVGSAGNYTITYADAPTGLVITPKALRVGSITAGSKTYTGTNPATLIGYGFSGAVTGDALSLTGAAGTFDTPNVGTNKTVTISAGTLAGADKDNYSFTLGAATTLANITPATLIVTPDSGKTMVYGAGALPAFTYMIGGYVNAENAATAGVTGAPTLATTATTYNGTVGSGSSVGSYDIIATANNLSAANYQFSYATATNGLSVTPATIVVTAQDKSMTYGGALPTLTATYGGFVNGDTLSSLTAPATLVSATAPTVNAGTYTNTITASGAVSGNYNFTYVAGNLVIDKAALTVTANDSSKFVTQADPVGFGGVYYTGLVNSDTSAALGGTLSVTRSNTAVNAAGTYTNVLTPSGLTSSNYTITFAPGSFTIDPADVLRVIVATTNATYGATPTYAISSASYLNAGSGLIVTLSDITVIGNAVTVSDGVGTSAAFTLVPLSPAYSTSGRLAVGSYALGASAPTIIGSNFSTLSLAGLLQITPKGLNPSASGVSKTYDGSPVISALSLAVAGVLGSDDVTLIGSGSFDSPNAGTSLNYTVSGLALNGADKNNYSIIGGSSFSASNGTITPKTVTLSANKTYDGNMSLAGNVTIGGLIGAETLNYSGATASNVNVTASSKFINAITLLDGSSGGLAANYALPTLNVANAPVIIAPRALTIQADDQSKIYGFGGNAASLGTTAYSITAGTFATGESLTGVTLATDATLSGAGQFIASTTPWRLYVTGATFAVGSASNYSISYTDAPTGLSINQKPLSITGITASNKVYDTNTTASVASNGFSGAIAGDALSLTGLTASFDNQNAGARTVTLTGSTFGGADAANYNFTLGTPTTTATITPRPITVTPDSGQGKIYGNVDPTLTYTLTSGSLLGADSLSGALARAVGESVAGGPYAINQGTLTNGNYAITFTGGRTFAISQRPITLTPDAGQSKTYGDVDPTLTYALTSGSLVGADNLSGALARAVGESVAGGPYAINLGSIANGNYAISFTGGRTFAITQRPITVTPDAGQNKIYGNVDPTLTYTLTSGNLVGTDTLSGALARAAGETVAGGPYAINLGSIANGNYAITFTTGRTFVIGPRPITVTPDSGQTKFYGNVDPTLTYTLTSGNLVGTDTLSGALVRAVGETIAGGPYAINLGTIANGNYTITFTGGRSFAISPRPLIIQATNQTQTYGFGGTSADLGTSGYSFIGGTSLASGESLSGVTLATNASISGAGKYTASNTPWRLYGTGVTFAAGSASNYAITYADAPTGLTINRATLTVTGMTASDKIYDGSSTASASATGLSGVLSGDDASIATLIASFASKNVGTQTVTLNNATLTGSDMGNYTAAVGNTTSATISPRALTIASIAASDKRYDATTSATIIGYTLDAAVAGDNLTLTSRTGSFDDPNVGIRTVTLTGGIFGGSDAGNYSFTLGAPTTMASILALPAVSSVPQSFTSVDSYFQNLHALNNDLFQRADYGFVKRKAYFDDELVWLNQTNELEDPFFKKKTQI